MTTTLDDADRKAKVVATAGGTTFSVAQYSYDSAGRLDCTALDRLWAICGPAACAGKMIEMDGTVDVARHLSLERCRAAAIVRVQ